MKISQWEMDVTQATYIILNRLKSVPDGWFAIDLVEATSIPRDVFDEAVSRLVRYKMVKEVDHRMIAMPDRVSVISPKPDLTWVVRKVYTK